MSAELIVIMVLLVVILLCLCALQVGAAKEEVQNAEYETLLTQYQLSQMQVRELERQLRKDKANPS